MRKLLLLLSVLLTGVSGAWAQRTVTSGSQVTSVVSGRAYLLQHQGNGTNFPWIEDQGDHYHCPNSSGICNTASVWYLYDNGDGTYKIKNAHTGKYWPKPTSNANLVGTDEENAGSWALNMSAGVAAPTCNGYKLNRNTPNLVGWNSGSGSVTQIKIYEVNSYNSIENNDLKGNVIKVGDAVSSITTDKWYVIKCNTPQDGVYYRGSIFENPGALYHNGNTSMNASVKWLFKFEDAGETNKYYVKTAYDNYFTNFTHNAQIGTRTEINGKEKITIAKINSTDGHFYFQSGTSGVIMDANGLTSGTASGNVVGWNNEVPAATGGNNDWGIYEVTIEGPTSSEVYTINNSSNGAMMYYSTGSTKYVWSSGKGEASFDASSDNCRWIFYPTGTSGQYYLYNVGAQKFAIPSGSASNTSWIFSSNAVAVTLSTQNDGSFKIITANGSVYASVNNGSDGPIINSNINGGNFTLTKVADASSTVTTQLTAAVNKLIDSQTKLTAKPASAGWYAIKIQSRTDQAGYTNNYLYTLATEYNNYPLAHASDVKIRPSIDNATYYFRIVPSGDNYIWQMPNGKYLVNSNGTYPKSTNTESAPNFIEYQDSYFRFRIRYVSGGYYYDYYADAYGDFIGETATGGRTKYDIYPINLETAGLTAWKVIIDASSTATQVSCSRSDVSGLTTVYNNGYIFLPSDITPTASDFSVTVEDGTSFEIDTEEKTITAISYKSLITTYISDKDIWTKTSMAGKVGYPETTNSDYLWLVWYKGYIARDQFTDAQKYTAEYYTDLQAHYNSYISATTVIKPQEAKTYTIANYANDGTIRYLYNNNGTIELTTESSITDDYKFVCHVNASGKYIFAMPNGNYLIWRGSSGAGQTDLATAKSGSYPLEIDNFPYEENASYNFATKEQAFGKLKIVGLRTAPSTLSSLVVKTSANPVVFDQANTSNFFSKTNATDQFSSAWIIAEVDGDYYNKVKLNSDGTNAYASLYLPFSVTIPEGITAYAVTRQDGTYAHMEPIVTNGILPKDKAAILKKDGQASTETIYLSPAEGDGTLPEGYSNLLAGTVSTVARNTTGTTYVLANIDGDDDGNLDGIGLYNYGATYLAKGKAYLFIPSVGVKALTFDFGDAVGVNAIDNGQLTRDNDKVIFNLAGQRISKLQRGVNIVNGKKVIIK